MHLKSLKSIAHFLKFLLNFKNESLGNEVQVQSNLKGHIDQETLNEFIDR